MKKIIKAILVDEDGEEYIFEFPKKNYTSVNIYSPIVEKYHDDSNMFAEYELSKQKTITIISSPYEDAKIIQNTIKDIVSQPINI